MGGPYAAPGASQTPSLPSVCVDMCAREHTPRRLAWAGGASARGPASGQVSGSHPRLLGSDPHLGVRAGEPVGGQMHRQRRMGTWPKALTTPTWLLPVPSAPVLGFGRQGHPSALPSGHQGDTRKGRGAGPVGPQEHDRKCRVKRQPQPQTWPEGFPVDRDPTCFLVGFPSPVRHLDFHIHLYFPRRNHSGHYQK